MAARRVASKVIPKAKQPAKGRRPAEDVLDMEAEDLDDVMASDEEEEHPRNILSKLLENKLDKKLEALLEKKITHHLGKLNKASGSKSGESGRDSGVESSELVGAGHQSGRKRLRMDLSKAIDQIGKMAEWSDLEKCV